MKPPKLKIQATLRDYLDFEGSLDVTIKYLEGLREEYKDVINLRIDYETVHSSDYYGTETGYKYYLKGEREETDAEYDKRIELAQAQIEREKARKAGIKKNKEETDRKEYERLRKKFEGK